MPDAGAGALLKPLAGLAYECHRFGEHDRHHRSQLLGLLRGRALDVRAVDCSDGQIDRQLDRVIRPSQPLRSLHLLRKFSEPALELLRVAEQITKAAAFHQGLG